MPNRNGELRCALEGFDPSGVRSLRRRAPAKIQGARYPPPDREGLRNPGVPPSFFFLSLSLSLPFLSLVEVLWAFGSAGAPALTSTSCPASVARRGRLSGELLVVVAPGVTGPIAFAPLSS